MIQSAKFLKDTPIADKKEELNVFFSEEYLKYQSKGNSEYLYIYSESYIAPIIINRKYIFTFATFHSEPFLYSETPIESEREFLDEALKYAKKQLKIDWFTTTLASSFFGDHPTECKCIPFGSHVCDLEQTEEELFAKMNSKYRNLVKRAEKDGCELKIGREELLADYAKIDTDTWERSERDGNGEDFYGEKLKAMPDNTLLAIVYLNGEPQAGAFLYYSKSMAYYMFGASVHGAHTGAGRMLHWKLMLYLKSMGVKKYSFVGYRYKADEGSKYVGIQLFKERFGGTLVGGYMFKCVLRPWKKKLFDILFKIKHASTTDAIDQEIHKWI